MQIHSDMRKEVDDGGVSPNDQIEVNASVDIHDHESGSIPSHLPTELQLAAAERGDSATTVSRLRNNDDDEDLLDGVGKRVALALEESDPSSTGEDDKLRIIPDDYSIQHLRNEMNIILGKLSELETETNYRKETFQTVRKKLAEWELTRSLSSLTCTTNRADNNDSGKPWRRLSFMRRRSNESQNNSAPITRLDEEVFALMVASKQCSVMDGDINSMNMRMDSLARKTSNSARTVNSEDEELSQNRLQEDERDVRNLKAVDRDLHSDVTALRERLSNLETQAGEYRREIISMREKVSHYEQTFAPYQDMQDLREMLTNYENALASYRRKLRSFFSAFRSLHGIITDGNKKSLDEDTFSLMMISSPCSLSWVLGLAAFLFQITLGTMMAINSSNFAVPFRVDKTILVAQFLTTILCLSIQSDVLTSVEMCVALRSGSNWDRVVGQDGNRGILLWLTRVFLPNLLKFIQGNMIIYLCYMIVIRSDNIMDLLIGFTALMVLSEIDNILFRAASRGYLGRYLKEKTVEIRTVQIDSADSSDVSLPTARDDARILLPEVSTSTLGSSDPHSQGSAPIRFIITNKKMDRSFQVRLIFLTIIMVLFFGLWSIHVFRQQSGAYFDEEYPGCKGHFALANKKFGDGICYGGVLNSQDCGFEGGDCINFNLAYPLCKDENFTSVEERIGNGICDEELGVPECKFDGGDCCPKHIFQNPLFGDGQCNGGVYNTKHCHYDGGDCSDFNRKYPDCPLQDLSSVVGGASAVLGNEVCDTGIYSLKSCGYKNGDCDDSQVGQDLIFDIDGKLLVDGGIENYVTQLSLDGKRAVVGLCMSNEDGKIDVEFPGLVKVYEYKEMYKKWTQLGGNILGSSKRDKFGCSIAMDFTGNRVAIGAPFHDTGRVINTGHVRVFDYDEETDEWKQIGEDIHGGDNKSERFGYNIDMSENGLRLAISTPYQNFTEIGMWHENGQIKIFDLNLDTREWNQVGDSIDGELRDLLGLKGFQLSSAQGSRIITSRKYGEYGELTTMQVYEYEAGGYRAGGWIQLGESISSQYSESSAISADGNRIAIGLAGAVQVYDLANQGWEQVGFIRRSVSEGGGNRFGARIAMSSDGDFLAIGSIQNGCIGIQCPPGAVYIYIYDKTSQRGDLMSERFHEAISLSKKGSSFGDININSILERERERDNTIFGRHLSMSADASMLSISGYNVKENYAFMKVYALNQLFDTKCAVLHPDSLGNGKCDDHSSYNTAECRFDGGDCI